MIDNSKFLISEDILLPTEPDVYSQQKELLRDELQKWFNKDSNLLSQHDRWLLENELDNTIEEMKP